MKSLKNPIFKSTIFFDVINVRIHLSVSGKRRILKRQVCLNLPYQLFNYSDLTG